MTFLPIVARELRVASRRRATYTGRIGAALIPVLIVGFWLTAVASQFSLSQGKQLFAILSTLTFAYCLLAGTRLTSDCLSSEKREGTIGLLFLTDLKGYDVVLGKCVSCALHAFYGLLAIVPVLALALLLGGVTFLEVGRTALLFLNTLFLSMTAGVFVSTLSRNDRRALFAAVCVILVICAAPYLLVAAVIAYKWFRFGQGPQSLMDVSEFLLVSPVFAFQMLRSTFVGPSVLTNFYHSLLATHLCSWGLLALASVIVPRVCRERPLGRWRTRWLEVRHRWSYGRRDQRVALRRRLLDRNAFYWLAARERIKSRYVWFFVGAMGAIWCWSGWMLGNFLFEWTISFWVLFLVFLFLKAWLTSEVCTRLVEDRDSGAFELLLSSPLDLKDMARGQFLALRRQFGGPLLVVLLLSYLLMSAALQAPHNGISDGQIRLLFWSMMIMLIADLVTLQWVGMWQAINCNQINRASLAACSRVLLLPTVLFVLLLGLGLVIARGAGMPYVDNSIFAHACLLWVTVGLGANLFFGLRSRWCFLHQFRAVATQRFTASSPGLEPFVDLGRSVLRRVLRTRSLPAFPALGAAWHRKLKLALLVTPVLALVFAVAGIVWYKRNLQERVRESMDALRAAGQPVDVSGLRRSLPPVLDPENAALLWEKAAPQLAFAARLPITPTGPRRLEWPDLNESLTPEFKNALSSYVARNRTALELLHRSVQLTNSRLTINWSFSPSHVALWQALAAIAPACEALQFAALESVENGDAAEALRHTHALIGIGVAIGREPFLSAQHYRAQFLRAAVRALERLLRQHALSPSDLNELQLRLRAAEAQIAPGLVRGFIGERALALQEYSHPPPGPPAWAVGTTGWQRFVEAVQSGIEDRLGAREQALLDQLSMFENLLAEASQLGAATSGIASGGTPFGRAGVPDAWHPVLIQQAETIAYLRALQTALAIERFRAVHHNQVPDTLGTLVPSFIPQLFLDPFSLGSLRFQRRGSEYVVYSVGPDQHDDGGIEPTRRSRVATGRDLTFRLTRP